VGKYQAVIKYSDNARNHDMTNPPKEVVMPVGGKTLQEAQAFAARFAERLQEALQAGSVTVSEVKDKP